MAGKGRFEPPHGGTKIASHCSGIKASRVSAAVEIMQGTTSPVMVSRIINTTAFISCVHPLPCLSGLFPLHCNRYGAIPLSARRDGNLKYLGQAPAAAPASGKTADVKARDSAATYAKVSPGAGIQE